MRRFWLALTLGAFVVSAVAPAVYAERSKSKHHKVRKRKGRTARGSKEALSQAVTKAMGDLRWGMTRKQALAWAHEKVEDRYRARLAKAHDSLEDDSLRIEMQEALRRIRESQVDFTGRPTGWDVSFLKGEYTHRNGESMFVVKDHNSQNFYFFMKGRLWKWYKALDEKAFAGRDFNAFSKFLQARFGKAKTKRGELAPGLGKRRWLEWHDRTTRMRAVDQTKFYGFHCLVFEERATLARLGDLRRHKTDARPDTHAVVDSVTAGLEDDADQAPNIVDRITGQRHKEIRTTGGYAASAGHLRNKRRAAFARRAKRAPSDEPQPGTERGAGQQAPARPQDDDPLTGLGP